jgi:prepilin-type N-terminal cleavage/methylation domain-containing protein
MHGFTLIEVMMVVVIIGILAATAIPSFQRQVIRARASEAPTVLGHIRIAQESYRSEFGQYYGAPAASAFWPSTASRHTNAAWNAASLANPFRLLGVHPDQPVYFNYNVAAGYANAPGTQYPGGYEDWWYVSQAQADLDNDGTSVLFEVIAGRASIYQSADW